VAAPWSADRANRDRPSWDQVWREQRAYHQSLDEQAAAKVEQTKQKQIENAKIDQPSAASLATRTHKWGAERKSPEQVRAVFSELRDTVETRQLEYQHRRDAERQKYQQWVEQSDRQMIAELERRERQKKREMAHLVDSWNEATLAKRLQDEREKMEALKVDRALVAETTKGMINPRRAKKLISR